MRRILYFAKLFFRISIVGFLIFLFSSKQLRDDFLINFQQASDYIHVKTGFLGKEADENKEVELAGERQVSFKWKYGGIDFKTGQVLYQSLYDFYKSSSKTYSYKETLPSNWEEEYYRRFFIENPSDNSIKNLASDFESLGRSKGLTDDQIVEMILAFVQTIDYDQEKARLILSDSNDAFPSYPYEVLFDGKGVCTDKTFLAASILSELGYGTALFVYDDERHMALGVKCPLEYSDYGSGYCYAETTATGYKIGMIPDLDPSNNQSVAIREMGYFNSLDQFDAKKLGNVKIILKKDGKTYSGIIGNIKIAKEIETTLRDMNLLNGELKAKKSEIDNYEEKLSELSKKMEKYSKSEEYEKYNALVPEYNRLAKKYKEEIEQYNKKISEYNKKVNRYNYLIKQN